MTIADAIVIFVIGAIVGALFTADYYGSNKK